MKKIVPFTKDLMFKTKIGEITSISLDHTLKLDNNFVSGEFLIDGTYKIQESSELAESFNYKIPVDIAIDSKYDTKNCNISIDDFTYEIINEECLKVNISVMLDDLDIKDEKEEIENIEVESLDRNDFDEIDEISNIDDSNKVETKLKDNLNNKSINNSSINNINVDIDSKVLVNNKKNDKDIEKEIFDNLNNDSDYSIYRVYTVKDDDTVDLILEKFNVTREILADYNDLDNLMVGSKIIIPSIDE